MVATQLSGLNRRRKVSAFSPLFIAAMVATAGVLGFDYLRLAFSPLFIAAMVATELGVTFLHRYQVLSVRFSSRQWLLLSFPVLPCDRN